MVLEQHELFWTSLSSASFQLFEILEELAVGLESGFVQMKNPQLWEFSSCAIFGWCFFPMVLKSMS